MTCGIRIPREFPIFTTFERIVWFITAPLCNHIVITSGLFVKPHTKVESIVDRPDLSDLFVQELAKSGYPVGDLRGDGGDHGNLLRGKWRPHQADIPGEHPTTAGEYVHRPDAVLDGLLDVYIRAPFAEMAVWKPVLEGIRGIFKMNPTWQAMENQRMQGQIRATQADMHNRLNQISQTLRETSDIVTNSYWNRQAVYDHISEQRSDVMRGVQNVASSSGDVYKVPNGYDQYWMDGLGNFYGGSWLTQPVSIGRRGADRKISILITRSILACFYGLQAVIVWRLNIGNFIHCCVKFCFAGSRRNLKGVLPISLFKDVQLSLRYLGSRPDPGHNQYSAPQRGKHTAGLAEPAHTGVVVADHMLG